MLWEQQIEQYGLLNWDHEICPTPVDDVIVNAIQFIHKDFSTSNLKVVATRDERIRVMWTPSIGDDICLLEVDVSFARAGKKACVSYDTNADYFMPDHFYAAVSHAIRASHTVH